MSNIQKIKINGVDYSVEDTGAQRAITADTKLDYSLLKNAPTIPAKTSDLTNDSGFLTEHQSLTAYRTSAAQDEIDAQKASADSVAALEAKIPSTATSANPLADKAFVNSSIATATANYISNNGQPFTSVSDLPTTGVTNNDYAFVTGADQGNTYYDRYKATVNGTTVTWAKEYRLNNSSFTANQWAAIDSGITASRVSDYDAYATNKQDSITADNKLSYNLLKDTPTIPTVNNGKLTIKQNNVELGTFTANSSSDEVINITIPSDSITGITMNGSSVPVSSGVANLGTVITAHQDISTKADTSALTAHTGSASIHVSSADRAAWDGKSVITASTTNGNIKINNTETTVYSLPAASSSALGGVKMWIDGTTLCLTV